MTLDWNDFKDLSTDKVIPITLSEQNVRLILSALFFLDNVTWDNDIEDDREASIADTYNELSE